MSAIRLLIGLAAIAAAPLAAQEQPALVQPQTPPAMVELPPPTAPMGMGDPRLQTIDYVADQVFQVRAAPGYQVTLEFGSDERIESVAVGDSGAWQATANRRGNLLFVKPIQSGVSTNMTVVTDVRIYAFDLMPGGSGDMAYTVRFRYPGASAVETADADLPAQPPGRYRLSGERALRPSRISDDGRRTYIEWPATSALPAVYALDERGREMVVNGNMRDDLFVIDSVVPRLIFRIDDHVARAQRVAMAERR
ncbi:MAG TPA: TrbG/VirB9 family P-type conjugative transfer protein [Allosphingosinicella sp.]